MNGATVYKWVRVREDGRRTSAIIAGGPACVEYGTDGEWAETPEWLDRRGYGLTAFETLKDADRFLDVALRFETFIAWASGDGGREFELWEAEAEGAREPTDPPGLSKALTAGRFRPNCGSRWPRGTVMAKRLRLARKIRTWRAEADGSISEEP